MLLKSLLSLFICVLCFSTIHANDGKKTDTKASPSHVTSCKNNPSINDRVCKVKGNGHGAECVVGSGKDCGGWFDPDCDCYGTGKG